MRIYHQGANGAVAARTTMFVAPAADTDFVKGEVPAEWVDDTQTPRQIAVEFTHGRADVPGPLGTYMIARGLAQKTALLLPN